MNKKITVVIVCILLIIAVFFVVYLTADNKTVKKSITSEKYETASVTASMFTASCMSDTTLSKNEDFSMVDPKAEGLKSFISEKKEKAEVRKTCAIRRFWKHTKRRGLKFSSWPTKSTTSFFPRELVGMHGTVPGNTADAPRRAPWRR